MRKAILHAAGAKALRDEAALFNKHMRALSQPQPTSFAAVARGGSLATKKRDATAFVVSFKGVLLEGVEVVMIVISFGTSSGRMPLAAAGAAGAAIVVGITGLVLARPLARVPENSMKLVVGVLLMAFGTFWIGEGAGVEWPGTDLFIVALVVIFSAASLALTMQVRRSQTHSQALQQPLRR